MINAQSKGSVVTFENPEGPDSALSGFTLKRGSGTSLGTSCFYEEAVFCFGISPTIRNNILIKNTITGYGGGVYCFDDGCPTILNNTISENTALNAGGGISVLSGSNSTIENTILWDNVALLGPEILIEGEYEPCTLTLALSDVEGMLSSIHVGPKCRVTLGPGMIDADPRFIDPLGGDLHIAYTSPCRDSGNNASVVEPTDVDGDPRIIHTQVDIGADEFHRHLYWKGDATPGGSVILRFIDVPKTAPVILWVGSGVMDPPIHLKNFGDWHLTFPLLFEGQLGSIPGPDGLLPLPHTISMNTTPLTLPMQALSGSMLTNPCVMKIE